jgi:hypothetical protein
MCSRDKNYPMPFWMDTLCVPVHENLKSYRKKAITQMRLIYQSAVSVLVLDSWLQKLSFSSTPSQKVTNIYLCGWLHRLWTLQESLLAKEVYIQLEGGVQSAEGILEACREFEQHAKSTGTYIRFPYIAQESALSYLSIRPYVSAHHSEQSLMFAHVSRCMERRTTSRRSDETLCAATTMQLEINTLLEIDDEDEEQRADRRMEEFLKLVKRMPKGIIFHHNPRLQRRGFRWAPSTLMGGRPGDFFRDMWEGVSSFDGNGLAVSYSGIIIKCTNLHHGEDLGVVTVDGVRFQCYRIQRLPKQREITWHLNTYYAIVVRPFSEGSNKTDGMLGIVESPALDGILTGPHAGGPLKLKGKIHIECVYGAWVERIDHSAARYGSPEFGTWFLNEQEWLVL